MQLSDILSATQLDAMRAVATRKTDAETYAPNIPTRISECLYSLAANAKCVTNGKFWQRLQWAINENGCAVVQFVGKTAKVIEATKTSVFGKHLCNRLKAGDNLAWVDMHSCYTLDWETWKQTWNKITFTPSADNLPTPPSVREMSQIRINRDRQEMFCEAAQVIRNKKLGKRGFNMSFDEIRAMQRQEAYERSLRGVVNDARKIMAVL